MKKLLVVFMLLLTLILATGCKSVSMDKSADKPSRITRAFIKVGDDVESFTVSEYVRVSHNWIVITSTDGRIWGTSDANVVLVEE